MKDTFGKALYNYWNGDHRMPLVIRRDDGYYEKGSMKVFFTRKFYPTEISVSHHITGKILDVGCGVGRHVLHFQNRGFDITGIDNSLYAIKVCKERGCKRVKVMDALHLKFPPESFDTILLFGHNIGISGTLAGAKRLLSSLRKLIRPDGVLVMTSTDVTKTKKKAHKKYHQMNLSAGRYVGEVKVRVEYKDQIGDCFKWLHVKPKDLKKLTKATGWQVNELHETTSGEYSAVLIPC